MTRLFYKTKKDGTEVIDAINTLRSETKCCGRHFAIYNSSSFFCLMIIVF